MNTKKHFIVLFPFLLLITFLQLSCKKYLEKKPAKGLVVPNKLNDLQALLDNNLIITQQNSGLSELVADNFYVKTFDWQSHRILDDRTNYVWDKDATHINSYRAVYLYPVYYSNIVLDLLPEIEMTTENLVEYNNIKGTALFYRAFYFLQLAQLYCRPYSSTANTDPGIVLRLTSNINNISVRSTVQETYTQVINDLKQAAELLPENSLFPTRPNKAAAFGALARTYLSTRDYVNAGHYSNLSLMQNDALLDYNEINAAGSSANMPEFISNPEVLFYSKSNPIGLLSASRAKIDSVLYLSYEDNDLRKAVFFRTNTGANAGTFGFRGGYDRSTNGSIFTGIATDEMYLTRAECFARAGNKNAAITDLNTLMINRWKNDGSWVPFTASDANDALNKILEERRKELVYRGIRWIDLRRLNLENGNITLSRVIEGTIYTLPPNNARWVMLIPWDIINLSGIQQNIR